MFHHLIFEGAELAGKSWLMSQVYDYLESKYNENRFTLDGCHWFNCDVGVYGTDYGKLIIKHYLKIFRELKNKNLIIEKFHLSDIVYNYLYHDKEVNYEKVEEELMYLKFRIVLVMFPENRDMLKKRIQDRLNIYPHYERILRNPDWYIKQQKEYLNRINHTKLPYLVVKTNVLPNNTLTKEILNWIGEKTSRFC